MQKTKRRAKRLCRRWRLRGTAPVWVLFFVSLLLLGAAAVLLCVRSRLSLPAALAAGGSLSAFRLETQALALTRATGVPFSFRKKAVVWLRLLLLPVVRGGLLAAFLPAAGLGGIYAAWKGAAYPAQALRLLALCCLLMAAVSLAFFLRWNALLRAVPALLLCGASFGQSLRCSARLVAGNRRGLRALRRGFFLPALSCLLLFPLPFAALYYRQCETLLFLNEA